MYSKNKSRKWEPCPFPGCVRKAEHSGEHSPKSKGGQKRGPRLTPKMRVFIELMKSGEVSQTEACRRSYPKSTHPDLLGTQLMKHPLIAEALEEHKRICRIAAEQAATTEGKALGKRIAVTKAAVMERLGDLMNLKPQDTNNNIHGQVRAALGLAEILGMKIGAQNPDKFEGFTDSELEQYAKDGTVPERFASRFGITPGSPSQIM